jgi:hypothetical protein
MLELRIEANKYPEPWVHWTVGRKTQGNKIYKGSSFTEMRADCFECNLKGGTAKENKQTT